jgi:WS/DGAT/MGAT family acyltransferase
VWLPQPTPSQAQLAATALQDTIGRPAAVAVRAARALASPGRTIDEAREAASAIGEVVRRGMDSAPDTPLNVRIGPHRRIATVEARLDDLKRIKSALGGTVNDVVLAASAGAIRNWLHGRGIRTEGMDMRVCVPMSTRAKDESGTLGNQITQVVVPLPVYLADPLERLRVVHEAMKDVKESKLAAGAEMIAGVQDFAPPTILAQASRLNFSSRFFNVLVTNVPGPQFPLYLLGRRLRAVFPLAFLAGDRALAIAVMSYDGGVNFGLIADLDSMPDLDAVADGLERSVEEYLELSA